MKQDKNRNMMAYCPEIKVLDASIRDGGLCNNFRFTDDFVKESEKFLLRVREESAERPPEPPRPGSEVSGAGTISLGGP